MRCTCEKTVSFFADGVRSVLVAVALVFSCHLRCARHGCVSHLVVRAVLCILLFLAHVNGHI